MVPGGGGRGSFLLPMLVIGHGELCPPFLSVAMGVTKHYKGCKVGPLPSFPFHPLCQHSQISAYRRKELQSTLKPLCWLCFRLNLPPIRCHPFLVPRRSRVLVGLLLTLAPGLWPHGGTWFGPPQTEDC